MSSCHYLQDFAVQQVSSCWTVCPAGVQQYNIYRIRLSSKCPAAGQRVQQFNIYTIRVSSRCAVVIICRIGLSSKCRAVGQCVQQVSSNTVSTGFACPANVAAALEPGTGSFEARAALLSELPNPSSDACPQRRAPANKRQQNPLADMRFEVLPPPVREHPGELKQSLS